MTKEEAFKYRQNTCPFRDKNGKCTRYNGYLLFCDGACGWVVDFLTANKLLTMTRKEEILKKAIELVDRKYQDLGIKTTHECSVAACQEMAEWADEHPRKGLVDIEKVCEWLRNDMIKNQAFQGRIKRMEIIDGIIDNLRKAMEE